MPSNVSVKITADVVDLQAKFAVARAESSALTADLNKLARTSKEAQDVGRTSISFLGEGDWGAVAKANLNQAAEASLKAQVAVRSLGAELSEAHGHVGEVRELSMAIRELAEGNVSRLPVTMARLTASLTGFGTGALFGVAGAVAIGAAIGYAEYEALKAQKALDGLVQGFAITGRGAQMSAEAVKYQLSFLAQLPGSTGSAATGFLKLAAEHANWSRELINETGQLLPAFIRIYGDDAPKAIGKLTEGLSNLTVDGLQKLDRETLNLAPTQYEMIQNLIKTGDTAKAVSVILQILSKNSGTYIKSLGDQVFDVEQNIARVKERMAEGNPNNLMYQQQMKDLQAALAEIRREENEGDRTQKDNTYKDEADDLSKANTQLHERQSLLERISTLERETADASQRGDKQATSLGNEDIMASRQKLLDFDKRANDETYRNFEDHQQAEADLYKSGSSQRIAIAETELAKAKELFGAQSTEYAQAMARLNTERRAAASQGLEIDRKANRELLADIRKTTEEIGAIRRDDLNTDLDIAKMQLEAKRDALDEEVAAGSLANTKKLAMERELTEQIEMLDIQRLEDQRKLSADNVQEYNRLTDEIRKSYAKLALDLAAIDRQIALDGKKSADDIAKGWESANRTVVDAEGTLIRDVVSGRTNLGQEILSIGARMLEQELTADVKYWTERQLLELEGIAVSKTSEQGGLLVHLLGESLKTDSTAAGVGARVALEMAGHADGMAASVASGSAEILNNAYRAASGAYAALAGVPLVGPVLAPIAAGTAFAAVAAFDVLTSASKGEWEVKQNGALYALHEKEGVIPGSEMTGLRSLISSGFDFSKAAQSGIAAPTSSARPGPPIHFHMHATDVQSFMDNITGVKRQLSKLVADVWDDNPSLRPKRS